ncbi:MAG: YfhO family protein [Clostridia bacterium]|nr:YfhO family protein [Clostridia bacterium]
MIKKLFNKFVNKETITYVIFGVLTTLVNYIVYFALYNIFGVNYLVSNTIAWVAAVVFAYFTNKKFVFNDSDETTGDGLRKFGLFVAGRLLSFLIETLWMIITVGLFRMNANVSKILVAIIVIIANYFLSKFFVFGDSKSTDLIKKTIHENRYVYLTFAAASVIMLIVYFVYRLVPFGNITIMRMDLYHQYAPLMSELYERLSEGHSLLYSWYSGLGGGFLGNFSNYLGSPFNVIVLLFGQENVTEAISCLILLKVAFASTFFAYYLKKSNKVNNLSLPAFGVLYGFCAYFLAYYWNIMWLDAMVFFPLVILGVERIINKRKFMLYIVSLFFIMISNYYMAYMTCIFLVIYFFVYYFSKYKFTSKNTDTETYVEFFDGTDAVISENDDEEKEQTSILKRLGNSRFLTSGGLFAMSSIIAALLAAFLLIPTVYILQGSSATGNSFPTEAGYYFNIFDFIANHLASAEPTIRSSGTDVLPNVYCGMLTVVLIPIYLLSKKITVREKVVSLILLAIFFFSFNHNYLNFIWHGFHFPNDLPYRFSFMYSFILLTMAFKAFTNMGSVKMQSLGISSLIIGAFIVIIQELGSKNVDELTVYISLIFLVAYTAIIALYITKPQYAKKILWCLVLVVLLEIAASNTRNYAMDVRKDVYLADVESTNKIVNKLEEEDDGFYRIERITSLTCNDPALFNYRGVSTFSSMASEKLSNLQQYLGIKGNKINSYIYSMNTPIYNSMFSIKYFMGTTNLGDDYYELKDTVGDISVYENKYHLPVAFCADNALASWRVSESDPFATQSSFLHTAYGERMDDVFTTIFATSAEYSNITHSADAVPYVGQNSFFRENGGQFAYINVKFLIEESQNVYFYFYSSNVDCVVISYDDFNINPGTSERHILDVGYVEAGTLINVYIPFDEDRGDSGFYYLNAYGFNRESFEKAYAKFKNGGLNITEHDDTHIKGTVTATEDCLLYTSIPYDKGWTVKVDGVEVETLSLQGALLYIELSPGEHTVEFSFFPQGFKLGLLGSFVGVMLLVVVLAICLLMRKRAAAKTALISDDAVLDGGFNIEVTADDADEISFEETTDTSEPDTTEE